MRQMDYFLGTLYFYTILLFIRINIDVFVIDISSPILEAFCGSGDVFTPSLLSRHSCIHDFILGL